MVKETLPPELIVNFEKRDRKKRLIVIFWCRFNISGIFSGAWRRGLSLPHKADDERGTDGRLTRLASGLRVNKRANDTHATGQQSVARSDNAPPPHSHTHMFVYGVNRGQPIVLLLSILQLF